MRTTMFRLTRCSGTNALSPAPGAARRISPLLGVLILLAAAIGLTPTPASAQTCLQDEFKASGATQTLQCTANDVSVAAVDPKSINIFSGGFADKCLAGTTFSFVADFEILTTSKSSRSNIGIYFGTAQANALSGTCSDSIIAPTHPCTGDTNLTCGSVQYDELDGAPDTCGDTSSTDTSPQFGAGTEADVFEVDNVTCPLSGTSLSLPVCTSWQVPGKTIQCVSPGPSYPWEPAAIPGSPSKCSCGFVSIPVQPIEPAVSVAKSCNTANTLGAGKVSCDAGPEGSTVTYTVTITDTTPANEGGVIVDQICDNRYGQVFPTSGTCPAGTLGSIVVGSASSCASLGTIPNPGSASCTFQAVQGENATVIDTVTVAGHSALSASATFGPTASNTVTVTSSDAPSTATITKGLVNTTAGCATVRYSVDVANTSTADENLTLSAFADSSYGSITTVHDAVLGTTCGVADGNPGLGTFSGVTASSTNGGALPASLPVSGSDYKCQFDAQFCGATGPVEEFGTGVCTASVCSAGDPLKIGNACVKNSDCDATCPLGISHVNTINGITITGDESEAVTVTSHTFTVNECLASFTKQN
ncbi:MAG TPA: hypothetical protein VGS20_05405 [Candidatus Acidoferrales bacterium]|nr:hypothetical protein [Candidatus Acidoferrales bacterium]